MTRVEIPELLAAQDFRTIAAGEYIFRCHRLDIAGNAFNSRRKPVSRFTPIISPDGKTIPTLYAAECFDTAVYETVFRQDSSPITSVRKSVVDAVGVSQISVCRELLLVPLFTPNLRKWNIDESKLISSRKTAYVACRALAAGIWRDNPQANGIVWSSRQNSESKAYLLFGDRCGDGDLLIQQTQSAKSDRKFSDQMADAAERAGIILE